MVLLGTIGVVGATVGINARDRNSNQCASGSPLRHAVTTAGATTIDAAAIPSTFRCLRNSQPLSRHRTE
jgi:hypothetical protein